MTPHDTDLSLVDASSAVPLVTRDRRALDTYRAIAVDVEVLA